MSEPISAFAAYNKMDAKSANKPANKGKNGKNNNASKRKTDKGKQNGKSQPSTKAKPNAKAKSKAKNATKNGTGGTNGPQKKPGPPPKSASTLKNSSANKNKENGQSARNKSKATQPPRGGAKGGKPANAEEKKAVNGGIGQENIEHLVDELLCDDKMLSKAQLKKKQELEEYLMEQLEKGSNDESDDGDSFSSGEFSEEYTLTHTDSFTDSCEDGSETESATETESELISDLEWSTDMNESTTEDSKSIQQSAVKQKQNEKPLKRKNGGGTKSENIVDTAKKSKTTVANKVGATQVSRRRSTGSVPAVKTSTAGRKSTSDVSKRRSVKAEPLSPPTNIVKLNSINEGERVLRWLLNPIGTDEFFSRYWEQNACLVRRNQPQYYSQLISFGIIDQMLLKKHIEFTKNIDITSYKNGIRQTLNPEGRALPPQVWDFYGQGCSIRLLNPQTFIPTLFSCNTILQEYFHCMVGANAYLTPPNSQGFAPHYDDIEAFVLQIEGRKRWKLYKPRTLAETLPRTSSKNFSQSEIGEPILEEVLKPGDMLYFPRGTIHQACTEPGYHSLHITISVYQKQSYADLFEQIFPQILQRAIAGNIKMRRGLPLNMWRHTGIAYSGTDSRDRTEFMSKTTELLHMCLSNVNLEEVVDAAADQLAKKFQHEALPPEILPAERLRTIFGSCSRTNERGECVCDYEITVRTNVRLLRANILRLVNEEDKIRVYYYSDNSKEYCEYEPNFIEIDPTEAASVECIIRSYPEYVGVSQMPLRTDKQKIELVTALWERGLLMTEKPFK